MIPYTKELGESMKHSLKQIGKKYIFSMRDLMPDDAGLYQLDVEDVNMFSTDFKSKTMFFFSKTEILTLIKINNINCALIKLF